MKRCLDQGAAVEVVAVARVAAEAAAETAAAAKVAAGVAAVAAECAATEAATGSTIVRGPGRRVLRASQDLSTA